MIYLFFILYRSSKYRFLVQYCCHNRSNNGIWNVRKYIWRIGEHDEFIFYPNLWIYTTKPRVWFRPEYDNHSWFFFFHTGHHVLASSATTTKYPAAWSVWIRYDSIQGFSTVLQSYRRFTK